MFKDCVYNKYLEFWSFSVFVLTFYLLICAREVCIREIVKKSINNIAYEEI